MSNRVVFGIEWARVEREFNCIAVMDATEKKLLALVRSQSIGWSLQRNLIVSLVETYNPDQIWAEANSIGGPNIEALQSEGLPVHPFDMKKSTSEKLFMYFDEALDKGLDISAFPILKEQINQARWIEHPKGNRSLFLDYSVGGDTIVATALAMYAASTAGITVRFS